MVVALQPRRFVMSVFKLFVTAIATALLAAPSHSAEAPDTASAAYQRKDYEKAYQLALPAAEVGDAGAQYLLGVQFWRGRGVARNDATAAQWFTRAAEQNHSDAMTDLALMYQAGEGVEEDPKRAFLLLTKAADIGNLSAQFQVGKAFQHGIGVGKDLIKARYWYERADALEATSNRVALSPEARLEQPRFLSRLPDSCRPSAPPAYAMRKNDLTEVSGVIKGYIDNEGRIRGLTERQISADALKFDVIALFSVSLRSTACEFQPGVRDRRFEIPFKFVLR
jgi:TPR repeat protein